MTGRVQSLGRLEAIPRLFLGEATAGVGNGRQRQDEHEGAIPVGCPGLGLAFCKQGAL